MRDKPVTLITHVQHFIGPANVPRLLREEATVVCHDRSFAEDETRTTFAKANPGAEILTATEPREIAAEMYDRFGRLDALILNDPYPAERAPIDEAEPEAFRMALEALAVWPFALLGQLTPMMKSRNRGQIVFITSAAPLAGIPNYAAYAAARGAANALVPSLAKELARWGISVNAIAPNYIKNPDYFPPELIADEQAMQRMLKNIPLKRLGESREVAELVALFASGRCGFVTGEIIRISGGWT